MDRELFVKNIKKYCELRGVKPTVACKEAGVGSSFISDINRGQTPSIAKAQMLAEYLQITTSELLGEYQNNQDSEDAVEALRRLIGQYGVDVVAEKLKDFQENEDKKEN